MRYVLTGSVSSITPMSAVNLLSTRPETKIHLIMAQAASLTIENAMSRDN